MIAFIPLTDLDGRKIYIRISSIVAMYEGDPTDKSKGYSTYIHLDGNSGGPMVTETIETICDLLDRYETLNASE